MHRYGLLIGLFLGGCGSPLLNWERESLGYVRLAHIKPSAQSSACIQAAVASGQASYAVLLARKEETLPVLRTGPQDVRTIADTAYDTMHTQCKEIATPTIALATGLLPEEPK